MMHLWLISFLVFFVSGAFAALTTLNTLKVKPKSEGIVPKPEGIVQVPGYCNTDLFPITRLQYTSSAYCNSELIQVCTSECGAFGWTFFSAHGEWCDDNNVPNCICFIPPCSEGNCPVYPQTCADPPLTICRYIYYDHGSEFRNEDDCLGTDDDYTSLHSICWGLCGSWYFRPATGEGCNQEDSDDDDYYPSCPCSLPANVANTSECPDFNDGGFPQCPVGQTNLNIQAAMTTPTGASCTMACASVGLSIAVECQEASSCCVMNPDDAFNRLYHNVGCCGTPQGDPAPCELDNENYCHCGYIQYNICGPNPHNPGPNPHNPGPNPHNPAPSPNPEPNPHDGTQLLRARASWKK